MTPPPHATLDNLRPSSKSKLDVPDILEEIPHINTNPTKSEPVLVTQTEKAWFDSSEIDSNGTVVKSKATDMAFLMTRKSSKNKSWTVFNEQLSTVNPEQTSVGYLPILLAPAHKLNTLNTVVR